MKNFITSLFNSKKDQKKVIESDRKIQEFNIKQISVTKNKLTTKQEIINQKIQEIHDSFDVAADKLLLEAQSIIDKTFIDENAELKRKLGFSNAKGVAENQQRINNFRLSQETKEVINYFKQTYPAYKFITEQEIKNICSKYNLVFGESHLYKGDIPDKNLQEIANFNKDSIKKEDLKYISYDMYGPREIPYDINLLNNKSTIYTNYYANIDNFFICAPLSNMDVKNKRIVNGYKIEEIPDPIVLFPVRTGYLIISKWGLEGEDSSLTNEKLN